MAKQKPNTKISVGELKKVTRGMRHDITEREDERTMIQKNRNIGLPAAQDKQAAARIAQIRKENNYYGPIADRYQGLIDAAPKPQAGRDMPLPSSNRLFTRVKSWFK